MSEGKPITRREMLTLGGAVGAALVGEALGVGGARAAETPGAPAAGAQPGLPQVPRRVLGKTGQSIPILLVGGAVKLDPRFDPKLAEALRFGANYFDAADCYGGGTCESAVGSFLTQAKARDKVWITSKSDEHEPEGLEATLATALKKLQTDHVDMYYLHALKDPRSLTPELAKTADRLKKEGKIRFFGFSCHDGTVAELLQLAAKLPWIDSVMFRYNFREYGDKELNAAMDACAKANVGLIAMKTQGSEASFADAWKKFEQTGKWTKHQAVLKAVWADQRITAAVSHMDNFEKLKQNVAAAVDKAELSRLDREALDRYAAATRSLSCSGCDHLCGPAVAAPVQIGTTMRYLMYHDVYGEPAKARELFSRLPEASRRLEGIDFSGASAACPHGIDVAAHMRRAAEVLV
jgi:predicted aldo/keto reductase-like oxidoreductase